jgi:GT2 family glycosyltransferase
MPELAVVIVNFNAGEYLDRCLRSLEVHRGDVDVDVLVIDNASSDGSHRRAAELHPWIRLIENPTNVFLSPAWNQGIRETDAPYIAFLNPDTEWFEGTLADLLLVAREHPRAGMIGPLVRNSDGTEPCTRAAGCSRASPTRSATRSSGTSSRPTASRAATRCRGGTARPLGRWTGSPGAAC